MLTAARAAAISLTVAGVLALAACGGDGNESDQAAGRRSTPARAIEELGATGSALDRAVAAVEAGDRARANEILSEAYVEHFEHVEVPLEKVDAGLKEELEKTISGTLRDQVRSGASAAEFARSVTGVKRDLATAERKLG
jgi:ABC-type phosphate transport system substrate-binding protein